MKNIKINMLELEFDDVSVKLTLEEAESLYNHLHKLFGRREFRPYINPYPSLYGSSTEDIVGLTALATWSQST